MNALAWMNLALFLGVLIALAWPLAKGLSAVASGRLPSWMHKVEGVFYRLAGVDPDEGMHWKTYALGVLLFNFLGVLVVYALQRLQAVLPLNPQAMPAVTPDSAFNTAISFVTNTNWQGYGGESTMSYLVQMLALTVQNFLSAATAIAVVFALVRGFTGKLATHVGNFWADLTRVTLWVLLPISLVFALFLVGQGVIQNFDAYKDVTTLEVNHYQNPKVDAAGQPIKDAQGNPVTEPAQTATQQLAMGPVASQEAIKMLGTNGGGFFNANSAHPYENPTALTNLLQMLLLIGVAAGLTNVLGRMADDQRQGWAIFAVMAVLLVIGIVT
ncbi:MAG: potassium-transporting ATPase subunit KdpA, partial [Paucibacter sp.]|nr:potassium-transporting ATPase subunit KdpA [Roseateles sp.]